MALINNTIGTVALNGDLTVSPLETTTYTITASNAGGVTTSQATVTVTHPEPTASIIADPETIESGESATLTWTTTHADSVSIEPAIDPVDLNGTMTVAPLATTIYTLTATGPGGTTTAQVTITVTQPLPTIIFGADTTTINAGASATLTWDVANADTVSIDQGILDVAESGSAVVSPAADTIYTITAQGPGGTATDSVTITVISPISLTITSPTGGETITRPDVMVRGTFVNTTGNETGIMVNGRVAMVYGNQFVVNHVPLQEGENTIVVTATDAQGHVKEKTLSINAAIPEHYISMASNIESGSSPLEADLSISGTFSIEDSTLTYTSYGTVDFLETGYDAYRISMIDEGIYYFTADVIYETVTYSDTIAIVLVNAAQIDALLQQKWMDMKTKLGSGDITGALNHFSEGTKPMFEYNFNLLSSHLNEIIAGMQSITLVKIVEDQAQYNLVGEQGGESFSFHLVFQKATDGTWRIVNF